MSEAIIRPYAPGDIAGLKSLWRRVFHDPDSLIDSFFERLPDMGTVLAAFLDGRLAGMAGLIVGLELAGVGPARPMCGYIYAVAVEEDCRGRGIGERLVRAAAAEAERRGARIICTLPAEESLYGWYEKLLGLKCVLRRERFQTTAAARSPVMALSATEYTLWRESMLRDRVRLRPSDYTMDFVRRFFETLGGGLFACSNGICAAYAEEGRAIIRELLAPDREERELIAASVAAYLGCTDAEWYMPSRRGEAYIAAAPGSVPQDCVWDLSLD